MKAIIIHCAATKPGQDITIADVRRWHTDKPPQGRGWSDVGYHYFIRRDGTLETGRREDVTGAHVAGHNTDTLGVCMAGGINDLGQPDCNFTRHQWASLEALVGRLKTQYPEAEIRGHRDYDAGKACPTFDAAAWWGA